MTAGYSGTPLLKKLGVKPGSVMRLIDAPDGFQTWASTQPEQPAWAKEQDKADVTVLFAHQETILQKHLPEAIEGIKTNGGLWIAWPKKASKVPTDITENRLRDIILRLGLVDNKICAIDEKWSALRFVWRLENRPTS